VHRPPVPGQQQGGSARAFAGITDPGEEIVIGIRRTRSGARRVRRAWGVGGLH
jgi:hypothetical protein